MFLYIPNIYICNNLIHIFKFFNTIIKGIFCRNLKPIAAKLCGSGYSKLFFFFGFLIYASIYFSFYNEREQQGAAAAGGAGSYLVPLGMLAHCSNCILAFGFGLTNKANAARQLLAKAQSQRGYRSSSSSNNGTTNNARPARTLSLYLQPHPFSLAPAASAAPAPAPTDCACT